MYVLTQLYASIYLWWYVFLSYLGLRNGRVLLQMPARNLSPLPYPLLLTSCRASCLCPDACLALLNRNRKQHTKCPHSQRDTAPTPGEQLELRQRFKISPTPLAAAAADRGHRPKLQPQHNLAPVPLSDLGWGRVMSLSWGGWRRQADLLLWPGWRYVTVCAFPGQRGSPT